MCVGSLGFVGQSASGSASDDDNPVAVVSDCVRLDFRSFDVATSRSVAMDSVGYFAQLCTQASHYRFYHRPHLYCCASQCCKYIICILLFCVNMTYCCLVYVSFG